MGYVRYVKPRNTLSQQGFRNIFSDIRMIGGVSDRRDSLPAILPPVLSKLAGIAKLLPPADFAAGYPAVHDFANFARFVILRFIKRMRQAFPVNLQGTDLVLLEHLKPCVDAPRQRILLTIILLLFAQCLLIRLGQVRTVAPDLYCTMISAHSCSK